MNTIPFVGGRTADEPSVELTTKGATKILVRWPEPTLTDFDDFGEVAYAVVKVLAEAQARVAQIRADIATSEQN
jgi:hypothetical protein